MINLFEARILPLRIKIRLLEQSCKVKCHLMRGDELEIYDQDFEAIPTHSFQSYLVGDLDALKPAERDSFLRRNSIVKLRKL